MTRLFSTGRGLAAALATILVFAAAPSALAQDVMYGTTAGNAGGEFGIMDQSTGVFTALGDPTALGPLPAMSVNSLGEVYASNNQGGNGGGGGQNSYGVLIRIDPANGQLLGTVGDITDAGDAEKLRITDMAFQPGTDVLFGVVSKGAKVGSIYRIDTSTAVATLVGSTGLERGGLAFAPDGTLYLATTDAPPSGSNPVFARIDPTDGSVIGTPLDLTNGVEALAVRPSDGVVFANEDDGSTLFTIDPTDGTVTLVANYTGPHTAALSFRPAPIIVTRVQSFLVPERISLKLNAKTPARSTLRVNARLDECCSVIDYTQAVTLVINGTTWNLAGLTSNAKGTVFTYKDDELRFVLRPSLKGTSRGVLSITLRRDMTGLVALGGDVTVRLAAGALDVSATATLDGKRFTRGRTGGIAAVPVFPFSASVRGSDPDRTSVRATFGLNGIVGPVGDVTVHVGTFRQTLPGGEFTGSEERPRWSSREPGVRSVRIDYRRGKVTVSISRATVGFAGGDLTLRLDIGGEMVEMTITPRTKGTSFSY